MVSDTVTHLDLRHILTFTCRQFRHKGATDTSDVSTGTSGSMHTGETDKIVFAGLTKTVS